MRFPKKRLRGALFRWDNLHVGTKVLLNFTFGLYRGAIYKNEQTPLVAEVNVITIDIEML